MHIFFSGIGGTGIGPLALIAKQAGYEVSGSDKQDSKYIEYLRDKGLKDICIGQSEDEIIKVHESKPIDWFVRSSAVTDDHPEMKAVRSLGIKNSKRDELLNKIISEKNLKLIAVAGTHGKTTTTAMVVWLFKQLGIPISYSVGGKIEFGDMGEFDDMSEYFVYEADEFDRNFLAFKPDITLITGITWDHHEIFKTQEDYYDAFREFIGKSRHTFMWTMDWCALELHEDERISLVGPESAFSELTLHGDANRIDAMLAIEGVSMATEASLEALVSFVNQFPGIGRRMEQIVPGLYSDYAHTPEKVRGGMSVALDMAKANKQNVVVVFEPLHNRRQHYMIDKYKDCFEGAKKLYWIPSYLAREDPNQRVIPPSEMIEHLSDPSIAEPKKRDNRLKSTIQKHLDEGDMVVCMTGGGGNSLDEWVRKEFKS